MISYTYYTYLARTMKSFQIASLKNVLNFDLKSIVLCSWAERMEGGEVHEET